MLTAQRWITRAVFGGAAAVVALMMTAAPAAAHVEVSADKAQAGATEVTVSFSAESESPTLGIVSLQVSLPAGIAPTDVTLGSGPTGWTLTPQPDGYTVAGPALPAGEDAKYQVKIARLPADATSLAFKTLQTYSDGRVDRWIEIPQGGAEPENPAPVLTLAPAAPATPTPTATTVAAAPAADSGSSVWVWLAIGAVVLIALVGLGLWWRRRRA
jgi:uncharacterized protein YcnI